MPLSLDFLPKAARNTVEILLAIAAVVLGTMGATGWLETKAKAAAETTVDRLERKVDRLGCLVEVHIKNGKADDYVACGVH